MEKLDKKQKADAKKRCGFHRRLFGWIFAKMKIVSPSQLFSVLAEKCSSAIAH